MAHARTIDSATVGVSTAGEVTAGGRTRPAPPFEPALPFLVALSPARTLSIVTVSADQHTSHDAFLVSLDDATRAIEDPQELMRVAARRLGEHLDADRCAYADVEPDEDTFNLVGDYTRGVPSIVGRYRLAAFGAECLRLMRAGETWVVEDSEADPRIESPDAYRAAMIRAVVTTPLHKRGRFVAGMAVHQARPRRWRRDEIDLVARVTSRCWESIERMRIARELQRSQRRDAFLVLLDDAIRPLTAADAIIATASRMLVTHLGADRCVHATFEPDGDAFTTASIELRAGLPALTGRWSLRDFGAAMIACFGVGLPSWSDDVEADPILADVRAPYRRAGIRAHISVPLRKDGRLVAGWAIHQSTARAWQLDEIALVQRVADRCWESVVRVRAVDDLRRANEELSRTNRELGQYAYIASHDLQEPLRMIANFVEVAERRAGAALDEATRGFLRRARDAAARMQALVRDLLAYAQLDRADVFTDVDLDAIVAQALEHLRPRIEETGARVEVGALPRVRGDADRLVRLFQNLIGNAIKFRSPDRPSVIAVSATRDAAGWTIAVRDNGIGIPRTSQQRIFEVFQRLHRAGEYEGTGIGLAICTKIVEQHGWTITVASDEGEGATFSIIVPPEAVSEGRA